MNKLYFIGLKKILGSMERTMENKLNMKINIIKTKSIVFSRENNIRTRIKLKGGKIIGQIDDFKYLGSLRVIFLLWNAKESEVNLTTRTELIQRMRSGEQSETSCLLSGRTDGVGALQEPGRARFFRT